MDAKTFGAFLARMRKSQGLTQAELAQQLHVTDKAVSRWNAGRPADINTLEPLADALGLTLADLMTAVTRRKQILHRKSWKISLPCCVVNNPLTGARYGQFCFGSVPHWPSGASSPARAGWPSTGVP